MTEKTDRHIGIIIILGSPNDEKGNLSPMGLARIEKGFKEYTKRKNGGWKILLTGGFGEHFNTTNKPHAHYASQILQKMGTPKKDILTFAESKNTYDDAIQVHNVLQSIEVPTLLIVTSDFHLERVKLIFDKIFKKKELQYRTTPHPDSCTPAQKNELIEHEKKAIEKIQKQSTHKT